MPDDTAARIAALEADRQRVSRLLHDDIGQALTAAVLNLQFAGDAPLDPASRDEVVAELKGAIARLRDISLGLGRPLDPP